jgi:hypothetical protein
MIGTSARIRVPRQRANWMSRLTTYGGTYFHYFAAIGQADLIVKDILT